MGRAKPFIAAVTVAGAALAGTLTMGQAHSASTGSVEKYLQSSVCAQDAGACQTADSQLRDVAVTVDGTPLGLEGLRGMVVNGTAQDRALGIEGEDTVGLSIAWAVLNRIAADESVAAGTQVSADEAQALAQKDLESFGPDSRAAYGLSDDEIAEGIVGKDAVAARQAILSRDRYLESVLHLSQAPPAERVERQAAWLATALADHEVDITGWKGTAKDLPDLIRQHDDRLSKAVARG